MRRAGRKPKLKSYAALKRRLDAVFSLYIRRKAEVNGVVACCTCGAVKTVKTIQCGHFISRTHLSTRWLEENAAPQCPACNILRRGNYGEFSLYMIRKYGVQHIDNLCEAKRKPVKLSRADLQDRIDYFRAELEALKPS